MIWHLLNGDDVLRFKGFAEILRGRRLWRPKSLNDEGRVDQDATDRCRDDPDLEFNRARSLIAYFQRKTTPTGPTLSSGSFVQRIGPDMR